MDEQHQSTPALFSAFGTVPVRAADFKQIYANLCRSAFSNWDIQLTFLLGTNDAVGSPLVEEKATILMTPSQAKAVTMMMVNVVQQFEEKFGEIKLAPGQAPISTEQVAAAKAPDQK